jgi:hypothetical protein
MQVDDHIMRPHIVMNLIIIHVRDGIIFALYVLQSLAKDVGYVTLQ